jgi:antitoxin ParD1/3/4
LPILATITRNEVDRDEDFGMGMNVNLTPQLEDLVRRKVASGMYTSASEVVREALRLMEEQDQLRAARLAQLRNDIQEGFDSGPSEPWNPEATKRLARARRSSPGEGGTA